MKIVNKTFELNLERKQMDNLGFSKDILEKGYAAVGEAYKHALLEALEKEDVLPRRVTIKMHFVIAGPLASDWRE